MFFLSWRKTFDCIDSSLQLTDHLTSDNQEAADLLEMLDKVLQTKEVR